MGISIRHSMKLGKFGECSVVAGRDGLDRIIENITIMEVPDIVQWLKGGELILTSLFAIKDDPDAQNILIQQLYYAGASAIAIKPFQTMQGIPQVIIDKANEHDFPVIQIPEHIKYLDILSPVMHHIFNEKVVLQEDLEQATQVLQEISLHSQGIDVFLEHISTMTKNMVTIESLSPYIQLKEQNKHIDPLSKEARSELTIIRRPIRMKRLYEGKENSCIVSPIIVDQILYGVISSWEINHKHLPIDIAILEKAAALLVPEFIKLKAQHDIEQQYKSDFLRELLFNENISESTFAKWGEKYQVATDRKYLCILMQQKSEYGLLTEYKLNLIARLQEKFPFALLSLIRNRLCIILPVDRIDIEKEVQIVCREIGKCLKHDAFHLAVSEVKHGPNGIKKGYRQVEQMMELVGSVYNNQKVIYYSDLGVFRLIALLKNTRELDDFYEETIGLLLSNDKHYELFNTLKTYFLYNEVLNITAAELFIHVNTLKYRLNKIEEITGFSLKRTEDKVKLFLGVKIHEMLQIDKNEMHL